MNNMFDYACTFVDISKSVAERDTATESDADYGRRLTRHADAMLEPRDLLAPVDANTSVARHAHAELTRVYLTTVHPAKGYLVGIRQMEPIA